MADEVASAVASAAWRPRRRPRRTRSRPRRCPRRTRSRSRRRPRRTRLGTRPRVRGIGHEVVAAVASAGGWRQRRRFRGVGRHPRPRRRATSAADEVVAALASAADEVAGDVRGGRIGHEVVATVASARGWRQRRRFRGVGRRPRRTHRPRGRSGGGVRRRLAAEAAFSADDVAAEAYGDVRGGRIGHEVVAAVASAGGWRQRRSAAQICRVNCLVPGWGQRWWIQTTFPNLSPPMDQTSHPANLGS